MIIIKMGACASSVISTPLFTFLAGALLHKHMTKELSRYTYSITYSYVIPLLTSRYGVKDVGGYRVQSKSAVTIFFVGK